MDGVIRFKPIYQTRVWGGSAFSAKLGRSLPTEEPLGESWEVVDRPEAQSVIVSGSLAGLSLREALAQHAEMVMGPDYPSGQPFPILVKWLDCQDRLSLQVHPPAAIAPDLGGEPKTENWYIVDCEKDAAILAGLKPGVDRARFEAALEEQTLESLVPRVPVKPGDSLLVESGRIHAIDAGNLILEIQQNSDTTYRVYDWGRVGLDGKPRALHIEESLKSIDFEDVEPEVLHTQGESGVIADCEEFRIRKWEMPAGGAADLGPLKKAALLHVVEGPVTVGAALLQRGENVLLAHNQHLNIQAGEVPAVVLVTDRFY